MRVAIGLWAPGPRMEQCCTDPHHAVLAALQLLSTQPAALQVSHPVPLFTSHPIPSFPRIEHQ